MSIKLQLEKREQTLRKVITFKESENTLIENYIKYLESKDYEANQQTVLAQIVTQFINSDRGFKTYLKELKKQKKDNNHNEEVGISHEEANNTY